MCQGCVTNADTFVYGSVFLGSGAMTAVNRVRDRWFGGSPAARRLAAYAETAAFLRGLGLDAGEIIGPVPVGAIRP
jgi:hypothetical protein